MKRSLSFVLFLSIILIIISQTFLIPAYVQEHHKSFIENDFVSNSDAAQTHDRPTVPYLHLLLKKKAHFNFRKQLFDSPSTLRIWIQELNPTTGYVLINGIDTQQPSRPFTWDWGDGSIESGFFPRSHTYTNRTKNYNIKATSHYSDGGMEDVELLIRFRSSSLAPITLPSSLTVTIPDHEVALGTRLYPIPIGLTYFNESLIDSQLRLNNEYVLSVVAFIQYEYANGDVYPIDNGFRQVVLNDPNAGGMYSLWYTSPPSFASGNYGFQDTPKYSSFFHEMGHNFTLNSPADYHYGGKIDGNANAIFSESLANIFAHSTAYDILNDYSHYGFDHSLALEIKQSAIESIKITRNAYEDYLNSGKVFHSWNDPSTPEDETFGTFMTIAYNFCSHAENSGSGYQIPVKRMMALLQNFNLDWKFSYNQYNNSPEAEAFRATLMVTALSYAFSTDLRTEFRALNFPINDAVYSQLINTMK